MALLLARRLALMRDHVMALRRSEAIVRSAPELKNVPEYLCGHSGVANTATESGFFLLALEISALLWVVGGWSSLVALRFRFVRAFSECQFA